MEGIELLVTPEILEEKASEVQNKVNNVKEKFAKMNDMISASKEYWIGEGGDKHREAYAKYKEQIEEITKRLAEHPADLLSMAGIYREAEVTNTSTTEALLSDVIQ